MPEAAAAANTSATSATTKTPTTPKSGGEKATATTLGQQIAMWNPHEIAAFYGTYATKYDEEVDSDRTRYPGPFKIGSWAVEWLLANSQTMLGASARQGPSPNGTAKVPLDSGQKRVLDLGCGTGQSCQPFLDHSQADPKHSYELIGLDATPEMLDRARERKFAEVLVHDLEAYPYPREDSLLQPGTFDAVVCVGVMDFIKDPRAFLCYARRFLKPARTSVELANSTVVHTSTGSEKEKLFSSLLPTSVLGITMPERHPHSDLSSFTRAEMETLFRECGFLVERHERFMGYADSKTGLVQYYHGWLCTVEP